jgi:CubicO group peptidase (beta-lactamase class C family)
VASTDGWPVSTPEQQGMNSKRLAGMLEEIRDRELAIDCVLVLRNGHLVLEAYSYPFKPGIDHRIHSCTKSLTATLIGIAVNQGLIRSLDESVLGFFPDREVANRTAAKEAMTIRHLLTMTSGLAWQAGLISVREMEAAADPVQYVLDLPMARPPGTRFEYCDGASLLLSAILQRVAGESAAAFAGRHLFGPMSIDQVFWPASPQGVSMGHSRVRMLPTDMAKLGQLYLELGQWHGEQLVSREWVETATSALVRQSLEMRYGLHWWVDAPGVRERLGLARHVEITSARGFGGQAIFVVPARRLVVVFCGWLQQAEYVIPARLLRRWIVPGAEDAPLPENPAGRRRLAALAEELASPPPPRPVLRLPELARQISGTRYEMTGAPMGWSSFELTFGEREAELVQMVGGHDLGCTVGLDGRFRLRENVRGHNLGCRGLWFDDRTFEVERIRLGDSERWGTTFLFDQGRVDTAIRGTASGLLGLYQGQRVTP